MYKSFKFKLYPNKEQFKLINKSFDCTKFVYNYYPSKIKNPRYKDTYSNILDYTSNLKYEYQFLQEVDSTLIRKTLFYLYEEIFYQIDTYYLSSQMCNVCRNVDKNMRI